jgi:hypothetical protein
MGRGKHDGAPPRPSPRHFLGRKFGTRVMEPDYMTGWITNVNPLGIFSRIILILSLILQTASMGPVSP